MINALTIILVILLLVVGLVALRYAWAWTVSSRRLAVAAESLDPEPAVISVERTWLGKWLFRAGFRTPNATPVFVVANLFALLAGLLVAFVLYQSAVVPLGGTVLRAIPGAVGEVFLPLLWASPVFAVGVVVALPAILVRARRRKRIRLIEQDLPLSLDLLATLAEAGLSFDAALERVLETQRHRRPLADEFRLFRLEILTGRSRIESLRRLKDNINIPWFSIFVSALIHAEQIGASLAATLRAQADDLRNRRRERALAQAMAVPVKLLFPLIICFLPGIMIASLGPIIFQILQMLDQVLQNGF
ncbi:MAG: type II secretion system F family protein [Planctomycetaceae bacterium]|nr:type II secretion system F family protein [Planctomycetaceae bacterium]